MEMGRPMKNQYLVKTTPSGLALLILVNVMVGRAAASEQTSAAETAMTGDTAASVPVE